MKIMYVVQSLEKGGAERLILEVCKCLKKHDNIETLIVSLSPLNQYLKLSIGLNSVVCDSKIELSVIGKNKIEISSFIKIVEDFKPDIIHSNVYVSELISREYIFPNVKYFTHCHNNMPEFESFSWKTLFNKQLIARYYEKKRIEKAYIKCKNEFIAISKHTSSYYKKNLPAILSKNIHFLPNAIDYHKFYFSEKRNITNRVNLVMVGHMADYKNQIFLIDVLNILRKNKTNAYLKLIGDWRDNGIKIQKKAEEMDLLPYLSMPGIIDDVENQLKEQHVYVHSALSEPFGLVLIEAMSSGLPIVCLDGDGNRDIINDGVNGFILKERSPVLFSEKITKLIDDKILYTNIADNARIYAKQYDIEKYVNKLIDLYKK